VCKDARVNWEDLRYALAVARARTLSRAAEALGVSHTTVGRRLPALDAQLGVRLFDATPDGFHPTAADLLARAVDLAHHQAERLLPARRN
jgi:DNA-binding transcriptional LysR family regulator